MRKVLRELFVLGASVAAITVSIAAVSALGFAPPGGQEPKAQEPAPPAGQTYIGVKKCAPCHFDQFMQWQKDKHSKTFAILTEKYQEDPKCLKCHTTGYGEPTGFKDLKSTPDLANNTCENCHGPGSQHEATAKPFAKVKKLTPEQEKELRDTIWRVQPGNACINCHTQKAHKPSDTPADLKTTK